MGTLGETPSTTTFPAGGGPGFGAELWGWNKTDLTEFDTGTQLRFRNTLGTVPGGTMAASFVASMFQGDPGIRLASTSLKHGIILPVLAAAVTLPAHYIVRAHIIGIAANHVAAIAPFGMASTADWRGAVYRRDEGSTTSAPRLTTVQAGNQTLRQTGVGGAAPSIDTWNTALETRGGLVLELECWRQNGDNPTQWAYRAEAAEASDVERGALARSDCTSFADPAPDWNSTDMTRFGIGLFVDDGGAYSGNVDFLNLQVFAA